MKPKNLSAAELSQLATAIAELLAKDADVFELEVLQHFLSLLRDNLQIRLSILRQSNK